MLQRKPRSLHPQGRWWTQYFVGRGCKGPSAYWLSSKGLHHQWRVLCLHVEVVTKGYRDQTPRKTDESGLDSSGQCSNTHVFVFNVCCGRLCFELLDRPPYPPDLFPKMKKNNWEPVPRWWWRNSCSGCKHCKIVASIAWSARKTILENKSHADFELGLPIPLTTLISFILPTLLVKHNWLRLIWHRVKCMV